MSSPCSHAAFAHAAIHDTIVKERSFQKKDLAHLNVESKMILTSMNPMKTLFQVAITACAVSSTLAQTWTQTSAPSTNWNSVAASADGVHLVAAVGDLFSPYIYGPIYTSTNFGVTWEQQTNAPIKDWRKVACSADGSRLLAVAGNVHPPVPILPGIYTSADGGVTWKSNSVASSDYSGGAISANGSNLIVVQPFTYSTNAGDTWSTGVAPGRVLWLAASADVTKIVGGGTTGPLYMSQDFGVNWTNALEAGAWPSFASSADGNTGVCR